MSNKNKPSLPHLGISVSNILTKHVPVYKTTPFTLKYNRLGDFISHPGTTLVAPF